MKRLFSNPQNRTLMILGILFLFFFFIPWESPGITAALQEAFAMTGEYAREHVLLCLVPAFFIAGAISIFLNQQAVIRYLGPDAPRLVPIRWPPFPAPSWRSVLALSFPSSRESTRRGQGLALL